MDWIFFIPFLSNEEGLVHFPDFDVVVLEVVVIEADVFVFDFVARGHFEVDACDFVDSVVSVVGKNRPSFDLLLDILLLRPPFKNPQILQKRQSCILPQNPR